jgi:hypothetical protein
MGEPYEKLLEEAFRAASVVEQLRADARAIGADGDAAVARAKERARTSTWTIDEACDRELANLLKGHYDPFAPLTVMGEHLTMTDGTVLELVGGPPGGATFIDEAEGLTEETFADVMTRLACGTTRRPAADGMDPAIFDWATRWAVSAARLTGEGFMVYERDGFGEMQFVGVDADGGLIDASDSLERLRACSRLLERRGLAGLGWGLTAPMAAPARS